MLFRSAKYRKTKDATYGGLQKPEKPHLRDSLVKEQGSLCAYCNCRIEPADSHTKVEHWLCQTGFPYEELNYDNLLAACLGGHGKPKRLQHCDTSKGEDSICKNPSRVSDRIEDIVFFLDDGTIFATDESFDVEINKILNLNLDWMKQNRKAVLDGFILTLPKAGGLKKSDLQRKLSEWYQPQNGKLKENCMIVVHWLRKRLQRP